MGVTAYSDNRLKGDLGQQSTDLSSQVQKIVFHNVNFCQVKIQEPALCTTTILLNIKNIPAISFSLYN